MLSLIYAQPFRRSKNKFNGVDSKIPKSKKIIKVGIKINLTVNMDERNILI